MAIEQHNTGRDAMGTLQITPPPHLLTSPSKIPKPFLNVVPLSLLNGSNYIYHYDKQAQALTMKRQRVFRIRNLKFLFQKTVGIIWVQWVHDFAPNTKFEVYSVMLLQGYIKFYSCTLYDTSHL